MGLLGAIALGVGAAVGVSKMMKGPSMPAPQPAPPPSPPPQRVEPDVEKAKMDIRERIRRARGRAGSIATEPGLLEAAPPGRRPVLADVLG
jgi:hypothetical protein